MPGACPRSLTLVVGLSRVKDDGTSPDILLGSPSPSLRPRAGAGTSSTPPSWPPLPSFLVCLLPPQGKSGSRTALGLAPRASAGPRGSGHFVHGRSPCPRFSEKAPS